MIWNYYTFNKINRSFKSLNLLCRQMGTEDTDTVMLTYDH